MLWNICPYGRQGDDRFDELDSDGPKTGGVEPSCHLRWTAFDIRRCVDASIGTAVLGQHLEFRCQERRVRKTGPHRCGHGPSRSRHPYHFFKSRGGIREELDPLLTDDRVESCILVRQVECRSNLPCDSCAVVRNRSCEGHHASIDVGSNNTAARSSDFGSDAGRAALRALVDRADIVVESARPRALAQLGLIASELVASRPGLSWISITGYGRSEPYA